MRRLLAVGILGTLGLMLWACDGATPTGTNYRNPDPATVATATPTPRPTPTLVGLWKIANAGNLGPLDGYAIDISSHDLQTGEVRGRSVTKYTELNGGLLRGTARDIGGGRLHLDWQTHFAEVLGLNDTENGSMDVTADRRQMEGFIQMDFVTYGQRFTANGIVLRRQ